MESWGKRKDITTSPYWIYGGNDSCSNLFWNHQKAVEVVAMSIFHDYPKAFDRRLSIGDSCPRRGGCPHHPVGSHSTLYSLDVNYYTIGHSNTTQYRPGTETDDINMITKIWEKMGRVLIPGVFDWERNFVFFYRLKQIFPRCTVSINSVLKEVIMDKLKIKCNLRMLPKADRFISSTVGMTFNHHVHAHINLGNEIDMDFNVQDFTKISTLGK